MGMMFERLDLILPEEAFGGPMQMALDEALLGSVVQPTLRIYRWDTPCVTFGYFQKHDEVRRFHPELPLTRRWTGGGIVDHGRDLTFSLGIPRTHQAAAMLPARFYRDLHSLLVPWIARETSGRVRLATESETVSGASCFSSPAPDDLLDGDRKILGGAQRRSAGALLYQGSLLLPGVVFDPIGMADCLAPLRVIKTLEPSVRETALSLSERRYSHPDWLTRR